MEVSWERDKPMTKEFALAALTEISRFYNRLYYFPEKKPFYGEADYKSAVAIIDGLKEMIKEL